MFNHVLVPLDGSLLAECSLPHSAACALTSAASLTLLHVRDRERAYNSENIVDPFSWAIRKTEAEAYLQRICDRMRKTGVETTTAIIEGQAADGIINYAHNHDVDLIVLSSHGLSGLSGWNISSVVQKVLDRAYLSVLIVPAYRKIQMNLTEPNYQKIFVGLDGSRRAEWVLPEAIKLAAFHNASLLLGHIVPNIEVPPYLSLNKEEIDLLNQIKERYQQYAEIYLGGLCSRHSAGLNSIKFTIESRENQIDALHELAEQESADLVILSAHGGTGGYKRLYGSVALSFIRYGATPMLILQDLHTDILQPTQAEEAAAELPRH